MERTSASQTDAQLTFLASPSPKFPEESVAANVRASGEFSCTNREGYWLSPLLLQNSSSQVCPVITIQMLSSFQNVFCLLFVYLCVFFLNCTLMLFYWDFRKEQRLMHAINPPSFIRSQSDVLYLFSSYTSLKVIHSLYSFNGLSITISLKSLKIINVLISF